METFNVRCLPQRLFLVIDLCLSFIVTLSSVDARPIFPGRLHSVASRTFFVTSADVNEDGIEDLVATGWDVSEVSILFGVGGGEFEPERRFPVNPGANTTLIEDFDSDGHLDLVIGTQLNPSVVLLRGRGDGTFLAQETLATGGYPWGMVTSDFDSDGHFDLAIAGLPSGSVSILHGNGDGTFDAGQVLSVGGRPSAITLANIDKDSTADLLIADDSGARVLLCAGLGGGSFDAPRVFTVGSNPESMVLEDFNADGFADLAVANLGSDDVSVLLGNPTTVFSAETRYDVGKYPASIVAEDVDHDGLLDLLVANAFDLNIFNSKGGDLSLLRGYGNGLFDSDERIEAGLSPAWLLSEDLDQDGRRDIVVASAWGRVSVLFNEGMLPRLQVPYVFEAANYYLYDAQLRIKIADVTGDGLLDLITGAFTPGPYPYLSYATIYHGDPNLTFSQRENFFTGAGIVDVDVGDFDADGSTDFVLSEPNGKLDFYYSRGDGTFEVIQNQAGSLRGIVADDFDEDGSDDVLIVTNAGMTVILTRGRGAFQSTSAVPEGQHPANYGLVTADFNGDGHRDVIAPKFNSHPTTGWTEFGILLGRGDGSFENQLIKPLSFGLFGPSTADFNGDGLDDLAAVVYFPPTYTDNARVAIMLSRGDGTFSEPTFLDSTGPSISLVGDFDNDRIQDLIVGRRSAMDFRKGGGDGGFGTIRAFEGPYDFLRASRADLDGDGRQDVVALSPDEITVYLNRGPYPGGTPRAVATFTLGCPSVSGQEVLLSGADSTDGDSTPGTNDDIIGFEWFEVMPSGDLALLGQGEALSVILSPGGHVLRLVVTDTTQRSDEADLEVFIDDIDDDEVVLTASPAVLWPPNHRLIPVSVNVSIRAGCSLDSLVLLEAESSEPPDSPGGGDGATKKDIQDASIGTEDLSVSLRAERDGSGTGRYYTLRYEAVDHLGNAIPLEVTIIVPHNVNGVVAPLDLRVAESVTGTRVDWSPVTGARFYNVVRGRVSSLMADTDTITLGSLTCVEAQSPDTSTAGGQEDFVTPAVGEAFFYLVEYSDGLRSSFGAEDVPLPRVGGAGGCSQEVPLSGSPSRGVWIK